MTYRDDTRTRIEFPNANAFGGGSRRGIRCGTLAVCLEFALLVTNCAEQIPDETEGRVPHASTGGAVGTIDTSQSNGGGASAAAEGAGCSGSVGPEVVGTFSNYSMPEMSGIATSRKQPGLLYAQADSGSPPEVVAFSTAGVLIGRINLEGASNVDWEDVAIGRQSDQTDYIYIADTGDNDARDGLGARESVQIYRILEPEPWQLSDVSAFNANWEVGSYHYPNAACDSEALFVDPLSGEPYLITKTNDGHSAVYRASSAAFAQAEASTLEWVADFSIGIPYENSAMITAADISPAGDRVLLRTYTSIFMYTRKETWQDTFASPALVMAAPVEPQGEGIAFDADASGWFSDSELSSAIYHGTLSCR